MFRPRSPKHPSPFCLLRILTYKKPSLSYLDGYLDIVQYSCTPYDDVLRDIKPGNIYKFSIEATPSRTKITRSFIEDPNDQIQWILHRDISNGFMINEMNPLIPVSHRTTKINEGTGTSFVMKGVLYSGVLTVVDKDLFTRALCQGLGHGKAWGFGLIHIDKI